MLAAFSLSEFCNNSKELLQFVGYILLVFKIAIPLVIIILGALDFGKAVVASKDEEIKSSAKRLLWRCVAGIVIFFVPSLVLWLFQTVGGFNEAAGNTNFDDCKKCILTPWSC